MNWCPQCCSQHAPRACPGPLLATGPERHGRRFLVLQGNQVERCAVLIAESEDLWRARIVTYPNMLWSVPGGRGTMKFVGDSAQAAEGKAIDYIERFCSERRFVLREAQEGAKAAVKREQAARQTPREAQEERHFDGLPIRFGEERATEPAETSNLSRNGLFIVTDRLLPEGRTLKMVLELKNYSVPLQGRVAWICSRPEAGKQRGMGIQLRHAPHIYEQYIESLAEAPRKPEEPEAHKA